MYLYPPAPYLRIFVSLTLALGLGSPILCRVDTKVHLGDIKKRQQELE